MNAKKNNQPPGQAHMPAVAYAVLENDYLVIFKKHRASVVGNSG
jgi:hypothetical protein